MAFAAARQRQCDAERRRHPVRSCHRGPGRPSLWIRIPPGRRSRRSWRWISRRMRSVARPCCARNSGEPNRRLSWTASNDPVGRKSRAPGTPRSTRWCSNASSAEVPDVDPDRPRPELHEQPAHPRLELRGLPAGDRRPARARPAGDVEDGLSADRRQGAEGVCIRRLTNSAMIAARFGSPAIFDARPCRASSSRSARPSSSWSEDVRPRAARRSKRVRRAHGSPGVVGTRQPGRRSTRLPRLAPLLIAREYAGGDRSAGPGAGSTGRRETPLLPAPPPDLRQEVTAVRAGPGRGRGEAAVTASS